MVAEKVSSAMRNLLAPLYDILDEHSKEDSSLADDLPEDEELLEEFTKISRAFDGLKFPEEVIRDLLGDKFSSLIERPELPLKKTAGTKISEKTVGRERSTSSAPSRPAGSRRTRRGWRGVWRPDT